MLGTSDDDGGFRLQRATATYVNKVRCCKLHLIQCSNTAPAAVLITLATELLRICLQDERFRIEKRTYDNQYAQLYYCRLLKMAPRLAERVKTQWPGVPSKLPPFP